jgi:hypothetical protein
LLDTQVYLKHFDTVQTKNLFGADVVAGTKFESKLRIFRDKNTKFSFALFDTEQLAALSHESMAKRLLSQINCIGIHSHITHYFFWKQPKQPIVPKIYSSTAHYLPHIIRLTLFWLLFGISWINNYIQFVFLNLIGFNFTSRTKMQTLDTREFLFESLKQAEEEERQVVYIDFDPMAGKVVADLVIRLFPNLDFVSYIHRPHSLVLQEKSGDFYVDNPHWYEARQFLAQEKRDLILLASREGVEDELMFLEKIRSDQQVNFRSLILSDVREFMDNSPGWLAKTKLQLFSLMVLEQFLMQLDQDKQWLYQLILNIKTEHGIVVDHEGNPPTIYLSDLDNLEKQLVYILTDVVEEVTQVEIAGKIKRSQQARVLPSFPNLKESDYLSVRVVQLDVPFKLRGSEATLKTGYTVRVVEPKTV